MVLYILEKFPSKTEHFISNEIFGLYHVGLPLKVIAMKRELATPLPNGFPVFYVTRSQLVWQAIRLLLNKNIIGQFKEMKTLREFLSRLKISATVQLIQTHVQKQTIEHIHAHFAFLPTEVAQQLSTHMNVPFSFTAHAQDLYANEPKKLQAFMDRAKFVLTCTQYGKAYLQQLSPRSEHIHCVYHGIPLYNWPYQKDKSIELPAIKVLYVGRLVEKKGIHTLLQAISQLKERGIDIQCTLIGSGPLAEALNSQSTRLGLTKKVKFMGYVAHGQLQDHYKKHDVLVCPSVQAKNQDMDGLPNVVMEAMAMGLPVVASDLSGIPEIIAHRQTGMLFQAGSVEGIAQHIMTLAQDPELYQKIREAARSQLEQKFDLTQSNQQIKVLLKSAMAS